MGTFMVYPSQVVALVVPRNDTNTTISPVDSGGVSRLVETSIVVTLSTSCLYCVSHSSDISTCSTSYPLPPRSAYLPQMGHLQ